MNYSEMSDFEINREVAAKVGGFLAKDIFEKEKTIFKYHSNGRYSKFDPCNLWADAGPIIQENKIPLNPFRDAWAAGERRDVKSKNPLRAAMIVFLMMKEADNG